MIITEYNEQWDKEAEYKYGFDNGYNNGFGKGVEKKESELVRKMLSSNIPIKTIVEISGLSEEKILQLAEN
ncbi:MAG: hypothetical protein IKT98_01780 [Selenomonadaceae bacterium]|nr:hypothetical protein [Selenomonadaceae bacterium]